ncbi:MAG: hypothetical protein ACLPGW_06990 [Roseiarcus sp.]
MNVAERVTVDRLRAFVERMRSAHSADPGERVYRLSVAVLRHFFGEPWFNKHVMSASAPTEFLRRDFSTPQRREKHGFLVVELAEMLINLQNVDGFDGCIAQMAHGQIESTYAELDIAKSLCAHNISFRFVRPTGRKGGDYDLELFYPGGVTVCADTKCKIETTEISADSIKHSLGEARKQLPSDRPGFVFVKVPQHWIDEAQFRDAMIAAAEMFLRGTRRVVSVKFYVSALVFVDNKIAHLMRYKEVSNPQNRFDSGRDWDIFSDHEIPSGWNGMPPHWLRLFYFPDGL